MRGFFIGAYQDRERSFVRLPTFEKQNFGRQACPDEVPFTEMYSNFPDEVSLVGT